LIIYKNIYIIILSILFAISPLQSNSSEWYSNDEMATVYEAMIKIASESIYIKSHASVPENILKNYIRSIDTYGDYFTKREYQAFQSTLSSEYAGIGMILYQEKRDGKILCIPTNQKLLSKGISKYDELISIDGRSVKNKNFYLVSSWIRGYINSSVVLLLRKSSGKLKTIKLKRTEQHFSSVKRILENRTAMIQIIRFMEDTPQKLRRILKEWPKNIPIIIDLRGNGGGDFFASIKCADFLLPKGTLISTIETRKQQIDYFASISDLAKGKRIFVLQDKFTASAAEVFIAALTQNGRVQSIGEKSFGKGVAQKFIPLSNGGSLLLTYGKIITPNGEDYHKIGLQPTTNMSFQNITQSSYPTLY